MKLAFLFHPVGNLKESLTYYRETLGMSEAWREGEHTVALNIPGSEVQILLEDDEMDIGPGGVFMVDSVDDFYKENKEKLQFIKEPVDIPPGRYAIYRDSDQNAFRIIDMTNQ
ncbi:VOC family protein [Pseudalkalibacillus caeni]|uniref:VOC domain-containing protein n=1 Tax=Exobacillus caeni TaxID=2574798 RepID=A0A5R9F548_9BACL|nr:VOC family protein [Pseudalkalibacillus caeni]TLS37599.1 hypothetical protein FCL54_10700 [Pseudalkalibacillus caeni]